MPYFISCDWGTSSFRLRLVETPSYTVLAEVVTTKGIAATYNEWLLQNSIDRFDFFSSYLLEQINILEQQSNKSFKEYTIVISGMASSAIGMMELPYKKIPFNISAVDLPIHEISPTSSFPYKVIIISGVCSDNDVIRGEETIISGCETGKAEKQLFILPGTHSKHILTENGVLTNFKTFMTGEVFELLSNKSILTNSIERSDDIDLHFFKKGLNEALNSSFLNNIFHIRTNTIIKNLDKKSNYAFLSGLVIGEELKEIKQLDVEKLVIVSSGNLLELYSKAATIFSSKNIICLNADEALIKGQAEIFRHYQ